MKTIQPVLVVAGLILMLGAGCRSREKPKGRLDWLDAGYVMREECAEPATDCYYDCIKREASLGCTGCCRDEHFLCNTGQKYSFEYCKGAR